MSLSDIQQMSLEERLYLMEQLWESFKYEKADVAPPQWHQEILDERLKQYQNGETQLLSLNKLKLN